MAIKVWNYLDEYEKERDEIYAAIERVLKSGYLILGDYVKKFEEEFSRYCGVNYGVGVNSGTDALFLSLKALNIGPGDEVITVSNTAVPTVSAIVSAGAIPRFVDIDSETLLMKTDDLEKVINQKTKCLLPVHLFGQCVNMDDIKEIASKYRLKIIEDCAQSHGGSFKGKKAGSMSDIAAFSFYPTKNLGGYGDGGMVITNNEQIRDKLRRLRFYGMEKSYYSLEHGYNSRLDELHASILLVKLKYLDEYILKRKNIANTYDQALKNTSLILPKTMEGNKHSHYLYVCRHKKRDLIIEELKKRNIFLNISYPWPIHLMAGYKFLGYKEGDLPVTEQAAKEVFSLPMYPLLTNEDLETVIKTLSEILNTIDLVKR
jgi:aminotransferase EvaB